MRQLQREIGIRNPAWVDIELAVTAQCGVQQHARFQPEIERGLPVAADLAAGIECAADAAARIIAQRGRIDFVQRSLEAERPGPAQREFAMGLQCAVGTGLADAVEVQPLRAGVEAQQRRIEVAAQAALGPQRTGQTGMQQRQVSGIDLQRQTLAGPAEIALRADLIAAQREAGIDLAHMRGIGAQSALPRQRLAKQAAGLECKTGRELPVRQQLSGQLEIGIQVGRRIVAEFGRVEALQHAGQLEWLRLRQIGRAAQTRAAAAGTDAGVVQLQLLACQRCVQRQMQLILAQRRAQGRESARIGQRDVAGNRTGLELAMQRLQIDAPAMQGQRGQAAMEAGLA